MKAYIYISGLLTAMFLMGWTMSIFIGFSRHYLFLIAGIVVLLFMYIPLVLVKRKRHKQRLQEIIKAYKEEKSVEQILGSSKAEAKGWSMNNSPFRERKSGLTWGGGNIHAANAKRGVRKSIRI
jgi:ABC-type multidrug transport system fused ATPase/permease subunit